MSLFIFLLEPILPPKLVIACSSLSLPTRDFCDEIAQKSSMDTVEESTQNSEILGRISKKFTHEREYTCRVLHEHKSKSDISGWISKQDSYLWGWIWWNKDTKRSAFSRRKHSDHRLLTYTQQLPCCWAYCDWNAWPTEFSYCICKNKMFVSLFVSLHPVIQYKLTHQAFQKSNP